MLDRNDIKILRGMFSEQDGRLSDKFDKKLDMVRTDLRDEMHDMETRLVNRMDTMENRIYENIGQLLDTKVLPQIAELQRHCGLA